MPRAQLACDEWRQRLRAAHEHRDLAFRRTAAHRSGDLLADESGFVLRRRGPAKEESPRFSGSRTQASRLRRRDRAGELADNLGAAETLVERDGRHGEDAPRALHRMASRTTEAVDRLTGVAHREDLGTEAFEKRELQRVGVLELVDEHVAVTAA